MLKSEIIGNVGGEPELRYTAGDNPTAVLRFSVASNYRERINGEWEDRVQWVSCVVFGNRAESLSTMIEKGMRLYVTGDMRSRPWTRNDGTPESGLEIIARDVILPPKPREDDGTYRERPTGRPSARPAQRAQQDDFGDLEDLPF